MRAMIDIVAASLGVNRHRVETFNLHAKSSGVLHIVALTPAEAEHSVQLAVCDLTTFLNNLYPQSILYSSELPLIQMLKPRLIEVPRGGS